MMKDRDIHVLAGRVGSERRTKWINNMLNVLDKRVSDVRDQFDGDAEGKKLTVQRHDLCEALNANGSTLNNNGYPAFFKQNFQSITYKKRKLFIEIEEYVEERKEQREKLSKIKSVDRQNEESEAATK